MTAPLFGNIFVEIVHEAAIIAESPCPVVLVQAAGVSPGIDKVNFALSALTTDNDGKHIFIIHRQKFIVFRRICKFQLTQRRSNDAQTTRQHHAHGVGLVVQRVTGRPVETAPLLRDFQTAEFAEVALIHKIFQFEGVMTAGHIFGEVGNGNTELAARLNIVAQDFVLLVRTGVPAGEDQDLVVVDEEVGCHVVVDETDDVRLSVRRGAEVQVFIGIEHGFRTGEQHIFQNLEPGFRRPGDPVGIEFRHIVCRRDRPIHPGTDPGKVKVAFGNTDDRFRLTGRRGIFPGIVVEIRNDLAVLCGNGRTVADVREEFFRRGHQTRLELFTQYPSGAGIAEAVAAAGHGVHGGVFAERRLQAPVSAFIDDHFCAGHVLEEHGGLQGFHLVRVFMRQIGVPLVRQMRPPDGQIVRAVESTVQSGGGGQIAEGEIFRAGNFHARRHFVVDIIVGAGRHNQSPILFVAVIHPCLDLAYKEIGSIPQAHILRFFFRHFCAVTKGIDAPEDPHGEPFTEVITEIGGTQFLELF